MTIHANRTDELISLTEQSTAHNYHPLPVVITEGTGAWVTDVEGRQYLDCLAAYSAINFGHRNPVIVDAVRAQLERITLTSRAFHHDLLGPFTGQLAALTGKNLVLPMNTGAEAVETGIKVARKWGYEVKGVPEDSATIIVADGNFHGRTISIVSFSTDDAARTHFGPYTPGFHVVPYGDAPALADAIDDTTVAVLIEPIQGEAGVVVPPDGYLSRVRQLCDARGLLFIADEIQSGLGRTGTTFACEYENVVPDLYLLGKALGGGIVPVSAVVGDADVLGVIHPGEHGSTFGGNPLACAAGQAVVEMLHTGEWQARAAELGAHLMDRLQPLVGRGVHDVRGRGLWAGVDIDPALMTGREACEALLAEGILAKDTHGSTIRLAPPLVITPEEIDMAVDALARVLR
ncbi:ornithine--oxo-acid transaminase [Actinobacteria bacterium YIM 96077]|uniref:ornithine aminotransferase n=1 Tax=Phytoactinopolyspora halophila TaxID=1981511 RepID=A0A329QGX0_9ACTN|nr:ornithine--oxo-acid transaminase [Phytoactinopolyspora halophila]AYY14675.1 ornithine--oxo-acid transaminase [Actinobacteria bacterium YIM 96077]RAW11614.1 ornithine--oxo-acid transaminase [Phytoactinopolyspora halophila]